MLLWLRFTVEQNPQRLPDQHRRVFALKSRRTSSCDSSHHGASSRWRSPPCTSRPVRSRDPGRGGRGVRHAGRPVAEPAVMADTVLASAVAAAIGHRRGSARSEADSSTLVLFVVRRSPPAPVRRARRRSDRLPGRLRRRDRPMRRLLTSRRCRRVPDHRRRPAAGIQTLLTFLLLVLALSLRGARLPSHGELVGSAPRRLAGLGDTLPAAPSSPSQSRAADRVNARLPPALMLSLIRIHRLFFTGGDHRFRRPGLAGPGQLFGQRVQDRRFRT